MDENDSCTHLSCRLISFQTTVAKKLACESQWVKWKMCKQSWDFRTFCIHKVEAMRHWETLPSVPAMSVGDVCRRSADLVIFNVINVTEHSSPPSLPTPFAKWLPLSSPCRMETAPGFWMTSIMYSRELLIKPRRLTTWYFTVRVGVRRHARKQCRFLLRRQSRVGRCSIIYQVHDHPTKNPAEDCGGTRVGTQSRKTPE